VLAAVLFVTGCLDVKLPDPPPPPGPGSIQGRVVYAVEGRTGVRPAPGARLSLVSTSTTAVADAEGRFEVRNVRQATGKLLISFMPPADAGATAERQRLLDLEQLGAGPGKTIALGDVSLGQNGVVVGRATRADVTGASGHGGTTVFVPSLPLTAFTTDDGAFVLENLPETSGESKLQLTFFRDGYQAASREVSVRGGEETRLSAVTLQRDPNPGAMVTVTGTLRFDDGAPVPNARVHFVSATSRFMTTTNPAGAFSAQAMAATLYQVGIEADGAVSLWLRNVLLVAGGNDLGQVELARGVSTPLDLDAGVIVMPDAGVDAGVIATGPTAAIDPPLLELAPGATGQLSSGRSSGARPLTAHWRSVVDGGVGLGFSAADTTAQAVQVFAPDASGLFPVTLRVTDVLGVDSAEARAMVRVGSAPTVTLTAPGGTSVAPGAALDLVAQGVSTDGRLIQEYRWLQRTGPGVMLPPSGGAGQRFTVPFVSAPTPLTVEVIAVTDIGFESAPASLTLVLQPLAQATVLTTATPSTVGYDGGRPIVRLTAEVRGGLPDASYSFAWAPLSAGCALVDGGVDFTCDEAWALSNDGGSITEFLAPAVSGDKLLHFTVTATQPGGGSFSGGVDVTVLDRRPPQCQSALTPLSFQLRCDEPLVSATASFDAGPMGPGAVIGIDGGSLVAWFDTVLPRVPWDFELSGVTDRGGNRPTGLSGTLTPQLAIGPTLESAAPNSLTPTRPAWLRLSADGVSWRDVLVARASADGGVFGGERMVWELEPSAACTPGARCVVTPRAFARIPGGGSLPGPSTSAVDVAGRGYVIVSSADPRGLVEYRDGQWSEVFTGLATPLDGLGSDGRTLSVFSVDDGGVFARRTFVGGPDGGSFSAPEFIHLPSQTQVGPQLEFAFTPRGTPFALFSDFGSPFAFSRLANLWSAPTPSLNLGAESSAVKAVFFGETLHEAWVFEQDGVGNLIALTFNPATAMTMGSSPSAFPAPQAYDVARFGEGALVAIATTGGSLRLLLVSRAPGFVQVKDVTLPDGGVSWSNGVASFPRVRVDGAEVRVAWEEEPFAGGGFSAVGVTLR
jgi:hypothetical protein